LRICRHKSDRLYVEQHLQRMVSSAVDTVLDGGGRLQDAVVPKCDDDGPDVM